MLRVLGPTDSRVPLDLLLQIDRLCPLLVRGSLVDLTTFVGVGEMWEPLAGKD